MGDDGSIGGGTGCILFLPIAILTGIVSSIAWIFKSLFDHNPHHKRYHKSAKEYVSIRRRGTAIVDTNEVILVTAGKNKVFLSPGGKSNQNK
jgi:hypothetical protein